MRRASLLLAGFLASACAGAKPALPPPLPAAPAWSTLVDEQVVGPLAADSRHVYVATRDGVVRALEPTTGEMVWTRSGLPGTLSAQDGVVLVRGQDGRLTNLQPRTGGPRWSIETGIVGALPAVLDGDRALVAGSGLAAIDLADGRLLWRDPDKIAVTALPVRAAARLLSGESDGTLRCRDRASGASIWTLRTKRAVLAPPLVDERHGAVYLGTTAKRILRVGLRDGSAGWRWTVGADVAQPGLLIDDQVIFASFDAVLYSLRTGGNLAWRVSLPSRPVSGPVRVDQGVVVACLEKDLIFVSPATGKSVGRLQTAAEIRTPPLFTAGHLVLGLRDRSVAAFALSPTAEPPGRTAPPQADPRAPEPGGGGR